MTEIRRDAVPGTTTPCACCGTEITSWKLSMDGRPRCDECHAHYINDPYRVVRHGPMIQISEAPQRDRLAVSWRWVAVFIVATVAMFTLWALTYPHDTDRQVIGIFIACALIAGYAMGRGVD